MANNVKGFFRARARKRPPARGQYLGHPLSLRGDWREALVLRKDPFRRQNQSNDKNDPQWVTWVTTAAKDVYEEAQSPQYIPNTSQEEQNPSGPDTCKD